MSNLNRPRTGATTTPESPSAPPVRLVALLAISRHTEVIAVAERDDSRVAKNQIQRQGVEDIDQDARAERQILRQQKEAGEGEGPRQPLDRADAGIGAVASGVGAHACRPNSPAGRHSRMAMVAT